MQEMQEIEESGQQNISDAVMDMLHAEPRSEAPEVNAIGQLPRSEVEAILRDVDHPLHAAAVEHRRLLGLALRPMVERVSQVLDGFMRSPAAAEMTRSLSVAAKHLAVASGLNASAALPGMEAVRRGLAAMAPVFDTLSEQIAADSTTRLAHRNAALTTKMAAMRPPPGISTARLGGSVRDPFGLTRSAPDPLVGLVDLIAQAPRGPNTAARPAVANRHAAADSTTAAAGQDETNRQLVATAGGAPDDKRATGVDWAIVFALLAILFEVAGIWIGILQYRLAVEEAGRGACVEWQASEIRPPSQPPADDPLLPPAGRLDEPTSPVPLTAPGCGPRSRCAQ